MGLADGTAWEKEHGTGGERVCDVYPTTENTLDDRFIALMAQNFTVEEIKELEKQGRIHMWYLLGQSQGAAREKK